MLILDYWYNLNTVIHILGWLRILALELSVTYLPFSCRRYDLFRSSTTLKELLECYSHSAKVDQSMGVARVCLRRAAFAINDVYS